MRPPSSIKVRPLLLLLLFCGLFGKTITAIPGQSVAHQWEFPADSAFGSPAARDLNKEGVLDVILGYGLELEAFTTGIVALNGKIGQALWTVSAPA